MLDRLKAIPGELKSVNWSERLTTFIKKPAVLISGGIIAVLVLSAFVYGVWRTQQSPPQPIKYNHSIHIGFGVQCLYCHPGAWKGTSAGLPTITKCWGCHQQIPIKDAEQQKLADAVKYNVPIKWVPVFILPDFVFFNHRAMVSKGITCETCHGEVSRMTIVQPPRYPVNMGWCLHCHRQKAAGNQALLTKLTDCGTCHR